MSHHSWECIRYSLMKNWSSQNMYWINCNQTVYNEAILKKHYWSRCGENIKEKIFALCQLSTCNFIDPRWGYLSRSVVQEYGNKMDKRVSRALQTYLKIVVFCCQCALCSSGICSFSLSLRFVLNSFLLWYHRVLLYSSI